MRAFLLLALLSLAVPAHAQLRPEERRIAESVESDAARNVHRIVEVAAPRGAMSVSCRSATP